MSANNKTGQTSKGRKNRRVRFEELDKMIERGTRKRLEILGYLRRLEVLGLLDGAFRNESSAGIDRRGLTW